MPKVSIVMPVYNAEKYLSESIESIINQSYRDFELICIDDGSRDESLNTLSAFAYRDKRITVLTQENKGAAYARNIGLGLARGKYVIFLDCDDLFRHDLIEKCLRKAEQYSSDVVIYDVVSMDDVTRKLYKLNSRLSAFREYEYATFKAADVPEDIFNSFLVQTWNKFYSKEFLERNKIQFQEIKRSNDLFFSTSSLVLAERIILLNEILMYYRIGIKNNLQSANHKSPLDFYDALILLKSFLKSKKIEELFRISYIKLAIEITFYNLKKLSTSSAWESVYDHLKNEGFHCMGLDNLSNVKQASFWGWIQCVAFMNLKNKRLLGAMYCIYKLSEYMKFHGLVYTLKKAIK